MRVENLRVPNGAVAGRVLTSDANGVATWQPIAAGAGTVITGSGAPSAGTGSDGALYLDLATGAFWGPKASGAWPAAPIGVLVRDATTYDQLAKGT
jgi:hypothetical protein